MSSDRRRWREAQQEIGDKLKITFTYDKPVPEVEGYLYFANDVGVSRTFNPDDLEVTFGKVPSGKYAVEAIGFDVLDRADWPEVSIPEPPADR